MKIIDDFHHLVNIINFGLTEMIDYIKRLILYKHWH